MNAYECTEVVQSSLSLRSNRSCGNEERKRMNSHFGLFSYVTTIATVAFVGDAYSPNSPYNMAEVEYGGEGPTGDAQSVAG